MDEVALEEILKFKERFELETELRLFANRWTHKGLREIPIPKKDGTIRMLKIPTISDRAWQCLAKYALEPAHEATFHAHSYGFRTGRRAHDAQKLLFINLSSQANGIEKRVIELDIKKCFDRINHTSIMSHLNWKQSNLVAIHRSCHNYEHMCNSVSARVSGAGCGESRTSRSN